MKHDASGLSRYKLQQAIGYIDEHLAEHLSLEAIAQQIGISQFYFCRLFKQSMGVTPYQYLLQQRIERAKHLLLQDGFGIADIALAVGFANQSHFTRQFKQMVGMSPKHFVNQEQHCISLAVAEAMNVNCPVCHRTVSAQNQCAS